MKCCVLGLVTMYTFFGTLTCMCPHKIEMYAHLHSQSLKVKYLMLMSSTADVPNAKFYVDS